MKSGWTWLFALVTLSVVCAVGSALAADDQNAPQNPPQNPPQQPRGRGPGGPGGPGGMQGGQMRVSLGREMGGLNSDVKKIKAQVSDASKNASTILAVIDMEQHTANCKTAPPKMPTTSPTDTSKLDDYESMMSNLLRTELDLEEQLRNNQNDKAAETVKLFKGIEDDGHKEFRKNDD